MGKKGGTTKSISDDPEFWDRRTKLSEMFRSVPPPVVLALMSELIDRYASEMPEKRRKSGAKRMKKITKDVLVQHYLSEGKRLQDGSWVFIGGILDAAITVYLNMVATEPAVYDAVLQQVDFIQRSLNRGEADDVAYR